MSGEIHTQAVKPVESRSCGGCTMCCKLFAIPALGKPEGVWCTHCTVGTGCTIYETRPGTCRDFFCHYRIDQDVPERWKPDRSHMALVSDAGGVRITAHVDPQRPDAWRKAPYYQDLKTWSLNRIQAGKQVHVRIGARTIVILPDRDDDLGAVGDKAILTTPIRTPQGPSFSIQVVARDDPRAQPARAAAAPTILRR